MKFDATITGWGEEAFMLLEEDVQMLILFNEGAPDELADICVLHAPSTVWDDPVAGDTLKLGEKEFKITYVGEVAKETLKDLGHATICFAPQDDPLPGYIIVDGPRVEESDFFEGGKIEIF